MPFVDYSCWKLAIRHEFSLSCVLEGPRLRSKIEQGTLLLKLRSKSVTISRSKNYRCGRPGARRGAYGGGNPSPRGRRKIRNLAADPVPNTERARTGQKPAHPDSRILYVNGGPGAERGPGGALLLCQSRLQGPVRRA